MTTPILSLEGVSKRFVKPLDTAQKIARLLGSRLEAQVVRAVDGIDLEIAEGEVVGLVGESGCGKSTLGRVVAGIYPPSEGTVRYKGADTATLHGRERRAAELAVQMVFQDPMASLNPRLRVVDIIGEAPVVHGLVTRRDVDAYVCEVMTRVGLDPATRKRYPHQFSGGQRARIGIARALAVNPKVVVCDESTAALDVSIQAQVLNLFMKLREELGLTYLFVSHDLGVVEHIADRVAVMYLGRIVELAPAEELFRKPNHPYTQALLAEVPRLEPKKKTFSALKGELPSPLHPPSGCHFHPRCPFAMPRCKAEKPMLKEVAPGRFSTCHLNDEPAKAA
ncbi:ATP-binding cassette domain-containing protein [Chelatococcus sp. SYSU_G07232]|uniref:ATP-binding cassette domain-containing protein n=1 Tax=Chelatococcus albus TaxID=3047466 RepID=A0ABT7AJ90_9HYPH|nr:oligopeptide/dipeptide ABC transporter ATP-binding protein [Chelatococcus sp. SYSU_G07232]MDJ1159441.1 ATP-binding cassette domain-containing protein [Chelatococcus sp. SYSU_G07232]